MTLKEIAIREYISRINWKTDKWSYTQIEEDMKKFLGERPSLDIIYEKDVMVNEDTDEAKRIDILKQVNIIFTDDNDKIRKLEIMV